MLSRLFAPASTKALSDATVPRERDVVYSDLALPALWGALKLAPDYTASYEEIARKQLWARIAMNKIAYSIARLPLKVYSGVDDPNRERIRTGSLAGLIQRPNDSVATGTTPGLFARITYDLLLYGNAIIVQAMNTRTGEPVMLTPSCPKYWSKRDGDYVYNPQDGKPTQTFDPARIIHVVEPGPTAGEFGTSRLEAARLTLAIEYAAQRLGESTFNNGARPGGIINVQDVAGNAKERQDAVDRFKSEVVTRFGGVTKAGLPAVLEGKVSWLGMSHNLDDSAVVAHRQLTREEVAALFDIPQPAIGILDEANFASVDQLHVMFYQDCLAWWVKLIEASLNAQLVRPVNTWSELFVEFDIDAVLRGAYQQRMAGHNTAIMAGIKTRDEVRALENLPPMVDEQPEAGLLSIPLNYGVGVIATQASM
jgi:HK97 family phage portal protein